MVQRYTPLLICYICGKHALSDLERAEGILVHLLAGRMVP